MKWIIERLKEEIDRRLHTGRYEIETDGVRIGILWTNNDSKYDYWFTLEELTDQGPMALAERFMKALEENAVLLHS